MVKSVLGVNHKGLRDWVIQRVTAIVLAVYSIGMFVFFARHPDLAFYEWHGLFSQAWMKVATLIFVLSLLFHAWIGMWTILTDYVKIFWLRFILHILILLALISFFFAALLILWGV
jgi:succinate dehydrogenase / fumarate reductase membrane anchor subunit